MNIIKINDTRFKVIDLNGEKIPGNTGIKDDKYFVILSEIRAPETEGRIWYEFKKQSLYEQFDLRYLENKLGMDEDTARKFIPEFNKLL